MSYTLNCSTRTFYDIFCYDTTYAKYLSFYWHFCKGYYKGI